MVHSHVNFATLRAVTFETITLTTLLRFVDLLPMQQLESIKITKINSSNDPAEMNQQVWSVIVATGRHLLRYLHVPQQIGRWDAKQLSFDLPVLENFTLAGIPLMVC